MKAVVLDGKSHALTIDKPVPELSNGYALVKVMAAGICGTDIELLYHNPIQTDIVPGHEVAGIVVQPGGSGAFNIGDRVFLNCHITCMECAHCQAGDYIFCKDLSVIGFDVDGGDADYIAVPEVNLRQLPDDITFEQGVLLTDALGTPFHAAKKAEIKPGEFVGVSGVGPLGIMCILSVAHFGGIPVAIDVIEERLVVARRFGAAYTVNGRSDVQKEISAITNGQGLDKVIDCSGNAAAIKADLEMLKCRGTMVQVGVCSSITLNLFEGLISNEITLKGSRNFHDSEIPEMMELIRRSKQINDIFTHRFSFVEAAMAFELSEKREGLKIILGPDEGSK